MTKTKRALMVLGFLVLTALVVVINIWYYGHVWN
jgi:hypothetical protein